MGRPRQADHVRWGRSLIGVILGVPRRSQEKATYITRFEYGRTRAWFVRFERGGRPVRKLFSDGVYGGTEQALRAAEAFRESTLKTLPAPILREQSLPGEGRVYTEWRSYRHRKTGELVYYRTWSAWIRIAKGVIRHTGYSIRKHGRLGAREKAEAWLRMHQENQRRNYMRRKAFRTKACSPQPSRTFSNPSR